MENVEKSELTASEKLAQLENEKLTRRQAFARFGFQAGAAAVAALTADELLRKVGTEMRKRAGDNQIAQQVASEFQKAGVVSAISITEPEPVDGPPNCNPADVANWCRSNRPNMTLKACCQMVFGITHQGTCRSVPNNAAQSLVCEVS